MSKYVDGFVLVVPKDKVEEYRTMAKQGRDSWLKHGAVLYFECKGDDLKPQEMEPNMSLSFKEMTNAKEGDDVWFSFIVFEPKAHRDEVNQKVYEEMSEASSDQDGYVAPFDISQMAYGGFEAIVEGQKP